jgi:hypothetical protein
MKDRLYLLKPDFLDQGKAYFCPGCAQVEGMLSFYPALREKIEVFYTEFPRPRPRLVRNSSLEMGATFPMGSRSARPMGVALSQRRSRSAAIWPVPMGLGSPIDPDYFFRIWTQQAGVSPATPPPEQWAKPTLAPVT